MNELNELNKCTWKVLVTFPDLMVMSRPRPDPRRQRQPHQEGLDHLGPQKVTYSTYIDILYSIHQINGHAKPDLMVKVPDLYDR